MKERLKHSLAAIQLLLVASCSDFDGIRSPSKRIDVDEKSGSHVRFEGRWKATSQSGFAVIPKINTTSGSCAKETMSCTETIALLFSTADKTPDGVNRLFLQNNYYRVIEWSSKTIHAKEEAPVADIELRISLVDRSAERTSRETKARGSETANPNISRQWILE
jgi:hypothetical protein